MRFHLFLFHLFLVVRTSADYSYRYADQDYSTQESSKSITIPRRSSLESFSFSHLHRGRQLKRFGKKKSGGRMAKGGGLVIFGGYGYAYLNTYAVAYYGADPQNRACLDKDKECQALSKKRSVTQICVYSGICVCVCLIFILYQCYCTENCTTTEEEKKKIEDIKEQLKLEKDLKEEKES